MKSFLGLAAVASLGVAAIAPSAQAQARPSFLLANHHMCGELSFMAEDFAPVDATNIAYDLECDGLEREGFICLNNPSEECGVEPYEMAEDHIAPNPDYDVEMPEGFACLNNVNPVCENPRHYGVLYTEYEPPVTSRTDAVWAQLGESSSSDVTLPPRTAAPAPAPIQGLW